MKEAQKYRVKYASAQDIPSSEIPSSYDLRNISGVNFVGRVKSQGQCGSCYSFAFINVIENRLKLKHGIDKVPELSVQHLMNCNYMNEGCMGGWAAFNGFFAENAGLVEESCAPYKTESNKNECAKYSGCKEIARVSKTYKINPSNEEAI